jgi:predicted DCC family thiol-disulfide oxidoreductase YuxK
MKKETQNFQVFFDGACYLCSTEIEHYRNKKTSTPIEFVDISSPQFSAEGHGLDPAAVQESMHVKCEDGSLRTGVEAFFEIWRRIPSYEKLAWALDRRWLLPFLHVGYAGFAKVRPYLPKKKGKVCETGTCGIKSRK